MGFVLYLFFALLFLIAILYAIAFGEEVDEEYASYHGGITGKAVISFLMSLLLNDFLSRPDNPKKGRIVGSKTRFQLRVHLQNIFHEYGPHLFKRAHRMMEESFWKLLDLIENELVGGGRQKRKQGRAPNGDVHTSVRLAIAIRYFAGGDPIDLASVYKDHRSVVCVSIWLVVEAINNTKE
jgi:hypothetical protein